MKRMGIEPLYCEPKTSRRNSQHKIWPYLLHGLKIERANQAWALGTTYIPTARGEVLHAAPPSLVSSLDCPAAGARSSGA